MSRDRYPADAVHVPDEDGRPTSHYYGDGCPEHPARGEGAPIQPGDQPIRPQLMPRQPIHPRENDRWIRQVQPGVAVAVDDGQCVVIHTVYGTITVTDVRKLAFDLLDAVGYRDMLERTAEPDPDIARRDENAARWEANHRD